MTYFYIIMDILEAGRARGEAARANACRVNPYACVFLYHTAHRQAECKAERSQRSIYLYI